MGRRDEGGLGWSRETVATMRLLTSWIRSGILPDKDTTFAFLGGASAAGAREFHAELSGIYVARGRGQGARAPESPFRYGPFVALDDRDRGPGTRRARRGPHSQRPALRPDYLHTTLMLELARGKTLLVTTRATARGNEKLYALTSPNSSRARW